MLYQKFPKLKYDGRTLVDITKRIALLESVKTNAAAYDLYSVKEGEKIEDIAYDRYGDAYLDWIIILMNDIIDPFYDWPLSTTELREYVTLKYGAGNEDQTHHWELSGRVVSSTTLGAAAVSNSTYEDKVNEAKRKIKILRPEHIDIIQREIETILNG